MTEAPGPPAPTDQADKDVGGGRGSRVRSVSRGRARRADPEPLPYDGIGTVTVGTVSWLVALAVLLASTGRLRADGHLWWVATCGVGVALGLLGWVYCRRRAAALARASRRPTPPPGDG